MSRQQAKYLAVIKVSGPTDHEIKVTLVWYLFGDIHTSNTPKE
jgi:hypothetical protein